jgi:hypothetical protein
MRVTTASAAVEQFTIGFLNVRATSGSLYLAWDRTVAMVDFAVK